MKLKVVSAFKDKISGEIYPVGAVIEINDTERVNDIVERNLAEIITKVKPKLVKTKEVKK